MNKIVPAALISATLFSGLVFAQEPIPARDPVPAQDPLPAPKTYPRRGGFAGQFELDSGGQDLWNSEIHASHSNLGEGVTFSLGGFYRLSENSPFELQAFVGYKAAFLAPVQGGFDANTTRYVFQLLGNYRRPDRWYLGGGLVYHINPRYYDDSPGALDIDFDNSLGAVIEGGWSWIGLQYTYMKYSSIYGDFDASSYGVRMTWRFEKPYRHRR